MYSSNNRPVWTERQGRFQLSLWRIPGESYSQPEQYFFCVQHGSFKYGAWHNKRIWCSPKDLLRLSACLKSLNALVGKKNQISPSITQSAQSDSMAFFQRNPWEGQNQDDSTNDMADEGVPMRIRDVIEHIKGCIATLPELGIWWNRQDVEIDLDAVLISYGLRSQDFDSDEQDYLRKQLIILADLERNGGLLHGPLSQPEQPIVTEVTG